MISLDTLKLLQVYISEINSKAKSLTTKENPTDDDIILWNLACLVEEVWELSAEVRKKLKLSFSKKKVEAYTHQDLEDEVVDVLITLSLLLKSLWIENLDQAVVRKIWKNDERGYR